MTSTRTVLPAIKITGTIENYVSRPGDASFVFSDDDRLVLGAVAVGAGLAGLGGQAIATASHASSTEERAHYLTFNVAGESVQGWVWRSPFGEGDKVEVVGWREGKRVELLAIARPRDRVIALYPHCSRGRAAHIRNAANWWAIGIVGFLTVTFLLGYFIVGAPTNYVQRMGPPFLIVSLGVSAFFGVMTVSMAKKWMPFVRLAEDVFRALGWPHPTGVDLVRSSKTQRKPSDSGEYGTFYFRY